jgi:hypothetical protein
LTKRNKISQWNYQVLPCIELIKAPIHECPCIPTNCTIWRSKYELPSPITGHSHELQSVTDTSGTVIFDGITWKAKKRKHANKYTATKPDYYIRNNYIYITLANKIEVVAIEGLFNDPLQVLEYPSFCDEKPDICGDVPAEVTDCTSFPEKDLPIDNKSLDAIIEMCVPELIQLFMQGKEDNFNNSRDNNPLDKDGLNEK